MQSKQRSNTLMRPLIAAACSIIGLAACTTGSQYPSAQTQPIPAAPTLSMQGYGEIQFGEKLSQLPQALRDSMKQPIAPEERGCAYVAFTRYPNILFMVENDVITRADLRQNLPNSLNVTFNMSSAEVLKRHPSAVITEHKYDEAGHYLTLSAPDRRSAFVLEESKGRITEIRSGLLPSVKYVEGCA